MPAKKQVEKTEKIITTVPAKAVKISKSFHGVVVSTKAGKTAVVKVESVKMDKKYRKRYSVSRLYQVHDENNRCQVGAKVTFIECRPLSKSKRWRIIEN